MRTYLETVDGCPSAFEIDVAYIGPRTIARVIRGVRGTSNVRIRKPFSASPDIHVRFRYNNREFIVWEPYGDSSKYWIGPEDREDATDVSELRTAFERYVPPIAIKILGSLVSLDFLSSLF